MKKQFALTMAGGGLPCGLRPLAMTPQSSGFHKGLMDYRTTIWHYIGNMRASARLNCHSGLADLHSAEANNPVNCLPRGDEIRIASRLSEQEQSSLSETLRAWSKSKTDPESYKRWTLTSNASKTLNLSCSTRIKRHREKRGFRLVPLLARAVQDDSKRNNPITNLTSYRLNDLATCAGQGASLIGLRACGHAAFTMADRLSRLHNGFVDSRLAFTMAEILLSLTIIGVVAAITLPSLTGNINERTWNTQRKALYARFSQAIALMPALNGYGTLNTDASGSVTEDTATETFITDGLSKVLKINNICDNDHLADCGIVTSFTNMAGSQLALPTTLYELHAKFENVAWSGSSYSTENTKAAAFETQNGESIVAYYNQSCKTEYLNQEGLTVYGEVYGFPQSNMCVNFIYDLNGTKGPNTVGKDIGVITVFNATDSIVVAPMPSSVSSAGESGVVSTWNDAAKACTAQDTESRMPNIDELSALLINSDIFNLPYNQYYCSGSVYDANSIWGVSTSTGVRHSKSKELPHFVRCIKR